MVSHPLVNNLSLFHEYFPQQDLVLPDIDKQLRMAFRVFSQRAPLLVTGFNITFVSTSDQPFSFWLGRLEIIYCLLVGDNISWGIFPPIHHPGVPLLHLAHLSLHDRAFLEKIKLAWMHIYFNDQPPHIIGRLCYVILCYVMLS